MLDSLIKRIPLSTKVRLGLNAVGVSTAEQRALDTLIGQVGTNPVVSIVLGKEVGSLTGLTDTIGDWASGADGSSFGVPTARRILRDPRGKDMIASVVLDMIARSPDKDMLVQVIDKVSKAPLPGFGDTDYPDIRSFLTEGALPLVESLLPEDSEALSELGAVVKCPYCEQTHIFRLEG